MYVQLIVLITLYPLKKTVEKKNQSFGHLTYVLILFG